MTVNDTEYTVLRLLGKGKGGYSYLVTDGEREYVLKQIHHEPCEYYTFGDKLQSELRDYETLRALGIPLPRLLAVEKAEGHRGWGKETVYVFGRDAVDAFLDVVMAEEIGGRGQ